MLRPHIVSRVIVSRVCDVNRVNRVSRYSRVNRVNRVIRASTVKRVTREEGLIVSFRVSRVPGQ
jgi:hypothetical protein